MTETQRKGVRKSVVITLFVITLVLVISNVFVYVTLQSKINNLQNNMATLYDTVNSLNDIVNLNKVFMFVNHQTISQPASSYTLYTFSVDYAGYISVVVESSTTTNTYVRVIWSAYDVNYDERITVGASGEAVFPVLPCNNVQVRIGNENWLIGATETVSIGYHY
jgi:hypothetical protein